MKFIENVLYEKNYEANLIDSVDFDRFCTAILTAVEIYYQTHTARETCEKFGIPFEQKYVKILHQLFPKDMGLGGARKGSGNKKGYKFNQKKQTND